MTPAPEQPAARRNRRAASSEPVEDYERTIFRPARGPRRVASTTPVAAFLGVTPASVSSSKQLARAPTRHVRPVPGVSLTPGGAWRCASPAATGCSRRSSSRALTCAGIAFTSKSIASSTTFPRSLRTHRRTAQRAVSRPHGDQRPRPNRLEAGRRSSPTSRPSSRPATRCLPRQRLPRRPARPRGGVAGGRVTELSGGRSGNALSRTCAQSRTRIGSSSAPLAAADSRDLFHAVIELRRARPGRRHGAGVGHRRGQRCGDAGVHQADDACIGEAASARAALPATLALDEEEAPADARSSPALLLHRWQGSSDGLTAPIHATRHSDVEHDPRPTRC